MKKENLINDSITIRNEFEKINYSMASYIIIDIMLNVLRESYALTTILLFLYVGLFIFQLYFVANIIMVWYKPTGKILTHYSSITLSFNGIRKLFKKL